MKYKCGRNNEAEYIIRRIGLFGVYAELIHNVDKKLQTYE